MCGKEYNGFFEICSSRCDYELHLRKIMEEAKIIKKDKE